MNISTNQTETSNFITGSFKPTDAKNILFSMIDKNINLYKVQSMTLWEQNHNADLSEIENKITELKARKKKIEEIIERAKEKGSEINLSNNLELTIGNNLSVLEKIGA